MYNSNTLTAIIFVVLNVQKVTNIYKNVDQRNCNFIFYPWWAIVVHKVMFTNATL